MTLAEIQVLVRQAAASAGIPPELALGICEVESGFDPEAKSPVGALGLMQLMPPTAIEWGAADPEDPGQNAAAGCRYLAHLIAGYSGNVLMAIAAYNWGPGNIARVSRVPGGSAQDGLAAWPSALPRETALYIQRVIAATFLWLEAAPTS